MWKFDQSENTIAITTKYVIENNYPILSVVHYADDGSWGFFCGTTTDEKDSRVISMKEALALDVSLGSLFDLKSGWKATRKSADDEWVYSEI